jgi:hypothetical protein
VGFDDFPGALVMQQSLAEQRWGSNGFEARHQRFKRR